MQLAPLGCRRIADVPQFAKDTMQFYVMTRTYNSWGGHPTLSLIPEFLLRDAGEWGTAVSELTINFHLATSGPPLRTLEQMFADFHEKRLSLPNATFNRKKGEVTIDIATELVDGRDAERRRELSLPLFKAGVSETLAALGLLRKRLTPNDDFQLEAFLARCNQGQSRVPSTPEELAAFADDAKRKRAERLAAMSPWEKVGVDWQDYHPTAREILDDPYYWDGVNDFAPHGNDTGADLLVEFREWLEQNPSEDSTAFYRRLISRWGFPESPSNDLQRSVLDEAAVALAFAELKLRAACSPAAAELARAAIGRQRQEALDAVKWPHRTERLESLEKLEAKLPQRG
jgi:uncharacterized protein YfeS